MRTDALAGRLPDGAWVEFGAERDAKGDDRTQWRKANPSYPHRTPAQSMLRLKRKLTEADWLREGLGVWDEEGRAASLISEAEWSARSVDAPPTEGAKAFGVKFSADGTRVAVCGAMNPGEGRPVHVEIVAAHSGLMSGGTAALVDWFVERYRDSVAIVIDGASNAGAFANALRAAGVDRRKIITPSWPEVVVANTTLLEAVVTGDMTNLGTEGQRALAESATQTMKKLHGDKGAWSWKGVHPDADPLPVSAAALALWGAKTKKPRRSGGRKVVSG